MIKIFSVISMQSTVNPTALAAGISEALIITYAGLVVAIPVIVMHRYLQTKADAYAEPGFRSRTKNAGSEVESWSSEGVRL